MKTSRIILLIIVLLFISFFISLLCYMDSRNNLPFITCFLYSSCFVFACSIIAFGARWIKNNLVEKIEVGDWVELSQHPFLLNEIETKFGTTAPVLQVDYIGGNKVARLIDPENGKILYLKIYRLVKLPPIRENTWVYHIERKQFLKVQRIKFAPACAVFCIGNHPYFTTLPNPEFIFNGDDLKKIRPASFSEIFDNELPI